MTQTKFSTIEVDYKFWLVPEPVMKEPIKVSKKKQREMDQWDWLKYNRRENEYETYLKQKSGWIEIKEEHAGEFKGKTGLIEGKDFEIVDYDKQHQYENGEWARSYSTIKVAIPINTDQGRIVAVPSEEREDEVKMWKDVAGKAVSDFLNNQLSSKDTLEYYRRNYSIKRK